MDAASHHLTRVISHGMGVGLTDRRGPSTAAPTPPGTGRSPAAQHDLKLCLKV